VSGLDWGGIVRNRAPAGAAQRAFAALHPEDRDVLQARRWR